MLFIRSSQIFQVQKKFLDKMARQLVTILSQYCNHKLLYILYIYCPICIFFLVFIYQPIKRYLTCSMLSICFQDTLCIHLKIHPSRGCMHPFTIVYESIKNLCIYLYYITFEAFISRHSIHASILRRSQIEVIHSHIHASIYLS